MSILATMNRLVIGMLLVCAVVPCVAQERCPASLVLESANKVVAVRAELARIPIAEMDYTVPAVPAKTIGQLKNALSRFSNAAMLCEGPTVDPISLKKRLALSLHATEPAPPNEAYQNSDGTDSDGRTYGTELTVDVSRPQSIAGIIAIRYSIDIGCGDDNILLIYERQKHLWVQRIRWEAPKLASMSDAFGDFFEFGFIQVSPANEKEPPAWRAVVAHGTPWCSSRFSGFKIDILKPGRDAAAPEVLWHTERGYSRGAFEPRLTIAGDVFELRVNADCMWFDNASCFERRVIYRYKVNADGQAHRQNPLGLNARGFVEEWLRAPWSEAKDFTTVESTSSLQHVHDQFDPALKSDHDEFHSHSLGPVRPCTTRGTFQVQINSTLERFVPGKPGGDSKPLPSDYFHVRQVKGGYVMLSAPSEPDPACKGPDLMPDGE